MRLQGFLRPEKSLLRTAESSRFLSLVIWGLKSLYFDGLKKIYFYRIMLNFSTYFVRGQPMLLFWGLVDKTQMPKPLYNLEVFLRWSLRSLKYIKTGRKTLYYKAFAYLKGGFISIAFHMQRYQYFTNVNVEKWYISCMHFKWTASNAQWV